MQVVDHSKDLKLYLQRQYEHTISELLLRAKHEKDAIIANFEEQAQEEVERVNRAAQHRAREHTSTAQSSAHSDIDRKKTQLEREAVDQVMHELKKRIAGFSQHKKNDIVHALHADVVRAIKRSGHKPSTFTFFVYKKASIAGAKKRLDELAVRAEGESIVIEDSVANRLEDLRSLVTQHVLEHLEGIK